MAAQTSQTADTSPAPAPRYRPDWLRKPSGEDMAWAYPKRAEREEVGGKAVLHCLVAPDGGLTHCQVASEAPADYGFGAAALALAPQFQMTRPPSDIKAPSEITIPITFLTPPRPSTPSPVAVALSRGGHWLADHTKARSGPLLGIAGGVILVVLAGVALRRWSRRADGKDLSGPNSERR
ncbi:TonB family protein [Caulobacter sp.]|uniref:TonB family protein n=1 Tax=Caulobacter sp. TaxID=78 RepID=UPI003BAFBE20